MTAPRYQRRRDGNHGALVAAFRQMGCTVLETTATGIAGFPDAIIGCCRRWHGVEFKNPETRYGKAGLSTSQTAFDRESQGEPIYVVDSVLGVAAMVNEWRRVIQVEART